MTTTTPAHIQAEELCESFVNGNKTYVVGELASYPQPYALAVLGYMLNSWREDGSSARLHDSRFLVKMLSDRA